MRFFEEKAHAVVNSASIVPQDDPTLLFTNAGMNQFKDVFLGKGERPYRRAVNTQKCLRVSGKHNDLGEVGLDTYHHTFFEMLGNWSFGDYFKEEAIRWAWELLVDRWGLDSSRLYATVHEGDKRLGLAPDDEAAGFWRTETAIDPDHILYCGSKDNFWMMGETGPCGPCSEIHIDLRSDEERSKVPGRDLVNGEDPRVMEIWNLVFIQYDARADGQLEPLAAKHVDTGMGFERVVAVLQGVSSNYDTDLFGPVLDEIARLSPRLDVDTYHDAAGREDGESLRVAMRVVADHARAISFTVADGVMPGNVGRGYVIRRILRRAVRFGYQTLDFREPFLHLLVAPLIVKMGGQFPELSRNRDYVEKVIRSEEESFLETLGTGIAFFDSVVPYLTSIASDSAAAAGSLQKLRGDRPAMDLLRKAYVDAVDEDELIEEFVEVARRGMISGEVAFLLHDTYGFPVDLTQLMAREQGLLVEMERHDELMQRQKDRARASSSFGLIDDGGGDWTLISDGASSEFVGYESTTLDGVRIRKVRSVPVSDGMEIHEVVLQATPFYAESGGQVGDTGTLVIGSEELIVTDTRRVGEDIVHVVSGLPSDLSSPVTARVDADRRQRVMKHHTATHLLHAALRRILGPHVAQKGSLVAPDHLRFDFSHFERVTPEQLANVALLVNEKIQENIAGQIERDVPVKDALERGAMALFGEKYGDRVRVVTFDPSYSVELCGGTHVDATGAIGLFRFRSEGSVAAGIRRVEAVSGLDALSFVESEIAELDRVRSVFRSRQRPTDEEVADLVEQNRRYQRELEALQQGRLAEDLDGFVDRAALVDGVRLVVGDVGAADAEALRSLGQTLRDRLGDGSVAVLGAVDPGGQKAYLVASVSDDLVASGVLKAGEIVGTLARQIGGGGGGRPELATAGGKAPDSLPAALASAESLVRSKLN
jgi:alanyl-tRNA synthetase